MRVHRHGVQRQHSAPVRPAEAERRPIGRQPGRRFPRTEWDVFDVAALLEPMRALYASGEVTQATMAHLFGVSYSTLQRLLDNDRPTVSLALAVRLADHFGLSLDALVRVPEDDYSDLEAS